MKACLDCLPCLARNAIDLARKSAQGDAALEAEIARSGLEILGSAALDGYPLPPPCYARRLIDNALAKSGGRVPDPWAKEKKISTELALKLMEQMGLSPTDNCHNCSQVSNLNVSAFSASLREENAPLFDFEKRLRLSIAGNILDFSIYADLDIAAAMEQMSTAFTKPVDKAAIAELKRRMDEAKSILWIFDNCGEAVFDRLLMEPYKDKITLAVARRARKARVQRPHARGVGGKWLSGRIRGGWRCVKRRRSAGRCRCDVRRGVQGGICGGGFDCRQGSGELRDDERTDGQAHRIPLPRQMPCRLPRHWRRAEDDSNSPP